MYATDDNASASAYLVERYLARPTGKERLVAEMMHSSEHQFRPLCDHLTREACDSAQGSSARPQAACEKIHLLPIMLPHTDPKLGLCSYLNSCHKMSTCRYLHFRLDPASKCRPIQTDLPRASTQLERHGLGAWTRSRVSSWRTRDGALPGPQWIHCDVREYDLASLGKFDVILVDPPWDIHMSLPYGTLSDEDMRALPIPTLQDEGLLFLWVTGRAMEMGRALLEHWGYMRLDEIIWLKVNQTQRLIRTGRTGHWLNHGKEHCLVGLKLREHANAPYQSRPPGAPNPVPEWLHRGVATDVIVSQVRHTSRKPDELYSMIENMCPGGRKIELFGRRHNLRPGWLTLGNQLKSTHLVRLEFVSEN